MNDYQAYRILAEAVNEAVGKATLDSAEVTLRAAKAFTVKITKAKTTKDPEKRLKILKELLKDAKELRKMANEIPPDGLTDHTWRLVTSSWWSSAYAYTKAVGEKEVKEMTKEQTLDRIDMMIKYINHEIETAEKKL